MNKFAKIATAEGAGLFRLPVSAVSMKLPVMVIAFVGMALGLVGSCNTSAVGAHDAYAATSHVRELTHWQIKSYSKAVISDSLQLLNFTGTEIAHIFKAPALERHDFPSVVWQYMNGECVLDIYFNAGQDGNVLGKQAQHFEVRSRDAGQEASASCMKQLVSNRHGPEFGFHLARADQ